MKKFIFILAGLFISSSLFAQSFEDKALTFMSDMFDLANSQVKEIKEEDTDSSVSQDYYYDPVIQLWVPSTMEYYYFETIHLSASGRAEETAEIFLVYSEEALEYTVSIKVCGKSEKGSVCYILYKNASSLEGLYPYIPKLKRWVCAAYQDYSVLGVINYMFELVPEYVEIDKYDSFAIYSFPIDPVFERAIY